MTGTSGIILADEDGIIERGQWAGVARVLGPPWARLPSLTVGLLGVQVLWSVEMSYASPYLVSLGLSKSGMAAVFLAGPLSGLIVQPLIGVLADNSRSRFGRRRPLMLAGVVLCSCATLLLGYTKSVASIFAPSGSLTHNVFTIWLAVLAIYCIDFSINAVQALDRALLVDTLPTSEQPSGNAWAACMLAIGSVVGFYVGNINLPALFPFLGHVQLEAITVIASFLLMGTHLWTAWSVKERILLATHTPAKTLRQEIAEIWHIFRHLPHAIYQICVIQFFSWVAWFPVLFYTSLYIGELYKRSLSDTSADDADVDAEATRLGSRALFYSALVSLIANTVAPAFVRHRVFEARESVIRRGVGRWWAKVPRVHLATLWAVSHAVFASCMCATYFTTSVSSATVVMAITGFCWAITQWVPFALLADAILSHSSPTSTRTDSALELVGELEELDPDDSGNAELTPIHPRSHTRPGRNFEEEQGLAESGRGRITREERRLLFQEGSNELIPEDEEGEWEDNHGPLADTLFDAGVGHGHGKARGQVSIGDVEDNHKKYHKRRSDDWTSNENEALMSSLRSFGDSGQQVPGSLPRSRVGVDSERRTFSRHGTGKGLSAQAGAILGIHNIFIVIPQFLVTGLSSLIFALFDPEKSVLHGHHPGSTLPAGAPGNGTVAASVYGSEGEGNGLAALGDVSLHAIRSMGVQLSGREEGIETGGPNAITMIFWLGGVASTVAFVLTCCLAREQKRTLLG